MVRFLFPRPHPKPTESDRMNIVYPNLHFIIFPGDSHLGSTGLNTCITSVSFNMSLSNQIIYTDINAKKLVFQSRIYQSKVSNKLDNS
jgi:hypothetical protein